MAIRKEVPAMIGHVDQLSMGSRVRVGGGKGYVCLEYNGRGLVVGEVGRTVRVACVVRACVQGGPRWDIQDYTSLTVLTEDEQREFPPEHTLHPPLAAALS